LRVNTDYLTPVSVEFSCYTFLMEFVNLDELGCAKTCFVNTVSFFESCDDLVDVEEFDYLVFFKSS